jgi:hypothetical protein
MGLVIPPSQKDIVIYQGATFRDYLIWSHGPTLATVVPVEFPVGTTARAHVRKRHADAVAILRFSTENLAGEGKITLGADGRIDLELPDEVTAARPKQKFSGVWDLEIVWPDGDVCRLVMGKAIIDPEATHG